MLGDSSEVSSKDSVDLAKDPSGSSSDSISNLSHEFACLNENKDNADGKDDVAVEKQGQSVESSTVETGDEEVGKTLLDERREVIKGLLKNNEGHAKEGDKVYIIPQFWFNTFMNPDLNDSDQIEAINTKIICKDDKNFVLNDYDSCPYMALPEDVFNKLLEWYGLEEQSKPIMTYIMYDDETNSLKTEYNKCIFRLHYLTNKNSQRKYQNNHYNNSNYENNVVYISISRLATMKQLMANVLEKFFFLEHYLNIEKTDCKLWSVSDTEENLQNSVLSYMYKIDPFQFMSLQNKSRLKFDSLDCKLKDSNFLSGDIVIEVKQSGQNYHWLSNYFHYNPVQFGSGHVGLNNLGNTCYMNSALQCLVHVPYLRDYFRFGVYKDEINLDNPLGCQGNMANSFSTLVQNLYKDQISSLLTYSPSSFKMTIGHYNSMFSGYFQQDSQEFLAFLLDSLHEDLNRIKEKPYVEKPSLADGDDVHDPNIIAKLANDTWNAHLKRNDSIIVDLFTGLYKSTLECPACNNISITFDPYCDLTLPIPVETVWNCKVKIFLQYSPPCILEVELEKTSTYAELKDYISKCINLKSENLYGCEIYNHQFYNYFESNESNSKYLPLKELISDLDDVIFYEIKRDTNDDIVVPVLSAQVEDSYRSPRLFGVPFFLVISKGDIDNPGAIRKALETAYLKMSGGFGDFPVTISEPFEVEKEGILVKEKHGDISLDDYEEIYKYSNTSSIPTDNYFKIKLMNATEGQKSSNKSINEISVDDENNNSKPSVWVPLPHISLSKATDIDDSLEPIVKDLYDFYSVAHNSRDVVSNNIEKELPLNSESDTSSYMSINSDLKSNSSKVPTSNHENQEEDKVTNAQNNSQSKKKCLIDFNTLIICEWNENSIEEVFDHSPEMNWEKPAVIKNVELEYLRELKKGMEVNRITLEDCLNLFEKKEVLGINDSWYCPKCKEHRQASKQIQLWSTPDILSIHLKRFETQGSLSDKIDEVVHFPIDNFDFSNYLADQSTTESPIYDLIAVDNHYGGLGGGHYTAYVKNYIDNKWYYFDDSRVSETIPERSIAGSAYLLFYMRRTEDGILGSDKLNMAINKGREQWENRYRAFQNEQDELYLMNKTDEEISSDVDDELSDDADEVDEKATNEFGNEMDGENIDSDILSSNQSIIQYEQSKIRDYDVESLEVGLDKDTSKNSDKKNSMEHNSSRRKLRLLNKNYTSHDQIPYSPSTSTSSPTSFTDLRGVDSINISENNSEDNSGDNIQSPEKEE